MLLTDFKPVYSLRIVHKFFTSSTHELSIGLGQLSSEIATSVHLERPVIFSFPDQFLKRQHLEENDYILHVC